MTTLAPPELRAGGGRHSVTPRDEPSRYAAWRASWSVALRMARRDVRRHRGRSALVVVMVAVPTLLLSVLVTVAATSDVSGPERIEAVMGSGQALIEQPQSVQVVQEADPVFGGVGTSPATPIEGYDSGSGSFGNADAISRLVGAAVSPIQTFAARAGVGDRRLLLDISAIDPEVGLGSLTSVTSGRWPTGRGEAAVTQYGLGRGLPVAGQVTVDVDGTEHTLTIVGVAPGAGPTQGDALVMSEPLPSQSEGSSWVVTGSDPVTWEEVRSLNEYGLTVTSAAVLRDPPTADELPVELRDIAAGQAQETALFVTLGASMLLVITALLVGPAFAVSAARQRRTLALAASNGAGTAVLRRTVLAQALVLGGVSAVLGVVLGVVVAWCIVAWSNRDGLGISGPFDLRWGFLAGITLCAVLSTLVAALVPARRLGRLDIVGVMRGQSVSPPPSRLVFLAGVVLFGAGAAIVLGSTGVAGLPSVASALGLQQGGELIVTLGAVLLILGALLLVPVLLTLLGRLGGHLPTSLRMAARDLARHRARSAPSVAAVLAAVAGLTFGLTGLASDTEQQSRQYVPQTIAGEALVGLPFDSDIDSATISAAAPGLTVTEVLSVDTGDPWQTSNEPPTEPYRLTFVNLLPQGCTPERSIEDPGWEPATLAEAERGPPCSALGTTSSNGAVGVLLLPADEVVRRLDLDGTRASAVRDGAAVVRGGGTLSTSQGEVRLVRGTYAVDPQAQGPTDLQVQVEQDAQVPLVVVPDTKETSAMMLGASVLLATDTATTGGWATTPQSLALRDPSGAAISDEVAEQVQNAAGDDAFVSVETGFERYDQLVVAILLGVFSLLILVITLTSTALSLAEQQSDQATLAALGATRGTRRMMAGASALVLAAVGCLLGVAVGLVPGIAIARLLTSDGFDPFASTFVDSGSTLVIPWLQLAVVAVLVPLVAAGIAAAGIRRAPQVTRRT